MIIAAANGGEPFASRRRRLAVVAESTRVRPLANRRAVRPEGASEVIAAANGGEPFASRRPRLAVLVVSPASGRPVGTQSASMETTAANGCESLAARRRRLRCLTQDVPSPTNRRAVRAQGADMRPIAADRYGLGRDGQDRRGSWRRRGRQPERPAAAAIGCAESGVGGKHGDERGGGRRFSEENVGAGVIKPAEARPFALAGDLAGLIDAWDDLLAHAPRSGAERRPRERRRRRRRAD